MKYLGLLLAGGLVFWSCNSGTTTNDPGDDGCNSDVPGVADTGLSDSVASRLRFEALVLLTGLRSGDTVGFDARVDTAKVSGIFDDLVLIYGNSPEFRDLINKYGFVSHKIPVSTVFLAGPFQARDSASIFNDSALNYMLQKYGMNIVKYTPSALFPLVLESPEPLMGEIIYKEYVSIRKDSLSAIASNAPQGGGSFATAEDSGSGVVYKFYLGWGDCPAGCLYMHYWFYQVGGATVTLLEQGGSPLCGP